MNDLFTILLSVMEKLPATSYVRLVDIWLIFVQLYPFIQGNVQIFKNKIWKYVLRLFYSPSLKCMRTKVLPTIMDIQNPYLRDRTKKLYCITSYSVGAVYHDLVVFRKKWRWLEDGCCHRWWCLMFTRYQKDLVREPVKNKKKGENSTFGGGGPDPGIFHISKKKWCLKCILSHFKPF